MKNLNAVLVVLVLSLGACADSGDDQLGIDELADRYGHAVCVLAARCAPEQTTYGACRRDVEISFDSRVRTSAWPVAELVTEERVAACEAYLASAACGEERFWAPECDFGQGEQRR